MFTSRIVSRLFCKDAPVAIYQNLYASKPSVRNRIKVDNFKTYEELGKIKQHVFREHSDEAGLGPIPTVDECAKAGTYKNPEYFSYHNYTYYDFEVGIQCWHLPQPSAFEDNERQINVLKSCMEPVPSDCGCPAPPPSCSVECMKQNATEVQNSKNNSKNQAEGSCKKSRDESVVAVLEENKERP
ncbi:uncharacterized protein LOC129722915 [Wyeomyia smithii]|uniref:uncharacterized protein LOC129722915 n=1 Tax=Wyeomyia smithii TaxID=174621 RepID=UPI002467F828|nr:uncharacterized protein LOC129722915 [Wyeomyia smithii]